MSSAPWPQQLTATFYLEASSMRLRRFNPRAPHAYDSIPKVRLWEHLQKCQMPDQLISIIKDL
eukprot:1110801-Pelagomonas_calceolata.AAC.1